MHYKQYDIVKLKKESYAPDIVPTDTPTGALPYVLIIYMHEDTQHAVVRYNTGKCLRIHMDDINSRIVHHLSSKLYMQHAKQSNAVRISIRKHLEDSNIDEQFVHTLRLRDPEWVSFVESKAKIVTGTFHSENQIPGQLSMDTAEPPTTQDKQQPVKLKEAIRMLEQAHDLMLEVLSEVGVSNDD